MVRFFKERWFYVFMDEKFFGRLRERVLPYFEGTNPCHDFYHVDRVMRIAMKIGEKEDCDLEILRMAVLLHDVARKEQDDCRGGVCHAKKGGEIACDILTEMGCSEDEIERVVHCVEAHRNRGEGKAESVEARVLHDSDKLDAIGAIGIGRSFSFSGSRGSFVHISDFDLTTDEEYGEKDCAYREFLVSHVDMKGKMLTESGREIAESRQSFMREFFDRLNREVRGEL